MKFKSQVDSHYKYLTRRAAELRALLDKHVSMTRAEICKEMNIAPDTFTQVLGQLRKTRGVYTVKCGSHTTYELAREMGCGHPESAIVQGEEGGSILRRVC